MIKIEVSGNYSMKELYDHKPGEGLSPAEGEERFEAPVIPDEVTDEDIEIIDEIFGGDYE